MEIFAVELTSGEIATVITATLTAIGTAIVTVWRYVISPAIKTLRESISSIEIAYEKKLENIQQEMKELRAEYETRIKEMRDDHDEKMNALEIRHVAQLEKMDEALAQCHKERESAILWKARYEQRIYELEKVALEGKITAVPDTDGSLIISTANIAVSKMFGYTRSELVGMPVENLISSNFRGSHRKKVATHSPEVLAKFNRVINGGIALHKDGTKFPVTVEIDSTLVNGVPGWSGVITLE